MELMRTRSLTAFSRTDGTAADSDVQARHSANRDLRIRTLAHWLDRPHWSTDRKARQPGHATGRCKSCRWAQVRGWPLNCDVLPLDIKGASRFLRKCPSATLDIEPPEALWPEAKGQAASLATGTEPSPAKRGRSRANSRAAGHRRRMRPWGDRKVSLAAGWRANARFQAWTLDEASHLRRRV
jgi:hypothetical protein